MKGVVQVYRTDCFAAARKLIPDEMSESVPKFASVSVEGLTECMKEYEEAGSTRCVVAYAPSTDDLRGAIEAYIEHADFVRAFKG